MGEEEVGKLFIGGVDKDARQEEFQSLFQSKGEIEDIILMKDNEMPDRNRGFGFVKFKDPACAEQLLNSHEPLILNGKSLDIKRCRQRDPQGGPKSNDGPGGPADSPNKVFVGGLPQTCSEESLKSCFSAYGEVQHVKVMRDRNTGNLRGFAFVTFAAAEPVRKLINDRYVQFEGKNVEVKAAEHRYRFQGPDGQQPNQGYGYGGQQQQPGGYGQNNWQQPGAQGDGYNYNAGWGGQQQQPQQQQQPMGGVWGQPPQPMGNYGNQQQGYGRGQPTNQWNQSGGGYNTGYQPPNQQPNPGYGGGYQQQSQGGYGDQYSQQGYGNTQQPQQQPYGGSYGGPGGYGSSQPQQGGYAPPAQSNTGYNPQGYGGGGYQGNTGNYGQPPQQGGAPMTDPNSSGGPMRGSGYGQRVGNNTHGYHPYGK